MAQQKENGQDIDNWTLPELESMVNHFMQQVQEQQRQKDNSPVKELEPILAFNDRDQVPPQEMGNQENALEEKHEKLVESPDKFLIGPQKQKA